MLGGLFQPPILVSVSTLFFFLLGLKKKKKSWESIALPTWGYIALIPKFQNQYQCQIVQLLLREQQQATATFARVLRVRFCLTPVFFRFPHLVDPTLSLSGAWRTRSDPNPSLTLRTCTRSRTSNSCSSSCWSIIYYYYYCCYTTTHYNVLAVR